MKKTKFIGTVNGVEYNCVNDYNVALTKAIENDSLVQASSKTEVVDEPSELLLGFDGSKPANAYVDEYVSMEESQNRNNLKKLKNKLDENYEVVLREINSMINAKDDHAIENYLTEIDNVLDVINNDMVKTHNAMDNKLKMLEELKSDIYVLGQGKSVLDEWFKYYSRIKSVLQDVAQNAMCDEECNEGCCCDGTCKCDEGCGCNGTCKCNDQERQLAETVTTMVQDILKAFATSKF